MDHLIDVYTIAGEIDAFDFSKITNNLFQYRFGEGEISLPIVGRLISDYKNFFSLKNLHRKIAQDIERKKYDIVLVHPDRFTQAPFLLRFLKTKSVYYCEEPLRIAYEYALRFKENVTWPQKIYEEATRLIRKHIDRKNTRSAAFWLASCCHIRERMIEAYEVYPKISYPGINPEIFCPLKIKKENQILFIGSKDSPLDGYDLAEEALRFIPKEERPKLVVISWVKEDNKRPKDSELVKIYNQSIATLCLSRFETFGLVPLESMACGTPVVVVKEGGYRESVVDGVTGFLVDRDPALFGSKIAFLLKNPDVAQKMGKAGREYVEREWNWEKSLKRLEEILENTRGVNRVSPLGCEG
jgi:glycosyltransferase involved in cell wall biosynthesis